MGQMKKKSMKSKGKEPGLWDMMWQTPGGPASARAKPGAKSVGERVNFNNSAKASKGMVKKRKSRTGK